MAKTDTLFRLEQAQTPEEEILCLRRQLQEYQSEYKEFQATSQSLERELETNIEQLERRNDESSRLIDRLQDENEQLKSRLASFTAESQRQLDHLRKQNETLTTECDKLTNHVRELEQDNDDLERARRELAASLKDFEGRLDQQIERNVLLESEVSEKEEMKEVIQRLKDEARDLRLELTVNDNPTRSAEKRRQSSIAKPIVPETPASPSGTPTRQTPFLSPTTRVSALNIVSDLLRKVGALESKLSLCKKSPE